MPYRTLKRVYVILAGGAALTLFGHGAWAAIVNYDKFRGLLSDSLNNVFGVSTTIDDAGISAAVRSIGWADITVSLVIVALAVGVYRGHGALARFASSRVALAIYAWGILWGFVTAASRVTAAGTFYPEVWDVVERGANFLLPAALLYLTFVLRRPAQLVEREELPAQEQLTHAGTR
jgi:hypothetical protein